MNKVRFTTMCKKNTGKFGYETAVQLATPLIYFSQK